MQLDGCVNVLIDLMKKYQISDKAPNWLNMPEREVKESPRISIGKDAVDIDIAEFIANIDKHIDSRGLFSKEGKLQAVYIYTKNIVGYTVDDLPRWHVSFCSTLKQMQRQGYLEKYAEKEGDDKRFTITDSYGNSYRRELRICGNCLKTMHAIDRKWRDAKTYDFSQYISDFSSKRNFVPNLGRYTPQTQMRANIYNADFTKKASEWKAKNRKCESCLKEYSKEDLEVHHKNRLKYDDRPENWSVLCVLCHCIEHRTDNPRMIYGYKKNGRLDGFLERNPSKYSDYQRLGLLV